MFDIRNAREFCVIRKSNEDQLEQAEQLTRKLSIFYKAAVVNDLLSEYNREVLLNNTREVQRLLFKFMTSKLNHKYDLETKEVESYMGLPFVGRDLYLPDKQDEFNDEDMEQFKKNWVKNLVEFVRDTIDSWLVLMAESIPENVPAYMEEYYTPLLNCITKISMIFSIEYGPELSKMTEYKELIEYSGITYRIPEDEKHIRKLINKYTNKYDIISKDNKIYILLSETGKVYRMLTVGDTIYVSNNRKYNDAVIKKVEKVTSK